jgi:ABC-2 type transport system permease protein
MNEYRWLIRREIWENRAIWLIPTVVAGVLIIAALFGRIDVMEDVPSRTVSGMLLLAVGATFFGVMAVYSTWYLLDCLYADRRDKSVLFWKSLPLSDAVTVLSKLLMALVVIPLVYFAAADVATLLAAFIISVRAHSLVGSALWNADLWLQLQELWLYLILTSAIWYLPVAGYLLVISASAKRAVMLWSILPPLAAVLIERWFLGTHVVLHQLSVRLAGHGSAAFHVDPTVWASAANDAQRTLPNVWSIIDVSRFLSNPQTLIGAAVGVALIVCAIQLRTRRAEI